MAGAYSAFANHGVYTKPTAIVKVVDRKGKTIYEHTPETKQVLSERTATLLTDMLEDVITKGTGKAANIGGVTVDGNSSDMKMNIDKKGNVNCSFSVQGIGISAQVFINMSSGNNTASVSISPNFSNNNLTLNGNIVPLDQSNIFKGRSW